MLSEREKDILTNYRVFPYCVQSLQEQVKFNKSNWLPVDYLREKMKIYTGYMIEFESIVNRIKDNRTRDVLRLHYVDGLSEEAIAEKLHYEKTTIYRIIRKAMK